MADQRRTVHYRGRVQGVGFRYTTVRIAGRFRVTGFVKNLPNGEVELIVEGSAEVLDGFLSAVGRRMGDVIAGATVETAPATGEFSTFDIRFA